MLTVRHTLDAAAAALERALDSSALLRGALAEDLQSAATGIAVERLAGVLARLRLARVGKCQGLGREIILRT